MFPNYIGSVILKYIDNNKMEGSRGCVCCCTEYEYMYIRNEFKYNKNLTLTNASLDLKFVWI